MTTKATAIEAVEWPPLPKAEAWRTRYRSGPGMVGHYPWSYTGRKLKHPTCDSYETDDLFTADQTQAYAREANEQLRDQNTALDAACAKLEAEVAVLRSLLARYRNETPLGHQPHMIAQEVDAALTQGAQS